MSYDIVDFLESIVLQSTEPIVVDPIKTEETAVTSSSRLIDVLGAKKLRRLNLAGCENETPTKRYFTENEVEAKLAQKLQTKSSWVSLIKEKQQTSDIVPNAVAVNPKKSANKTSIKSTFLPDPTNEAQHSRPVSNLVWRHRDAKSELLISASKDQTVKIFKTSTVSKPECLDSIRIRNTPIENICLSSSRDALYCLTSGSRNVYSMDLGLSKSGLCKLPPLLGRSDQTSFLKAISFDQNLCLLDSQGKIYQVDERTRRCVRVFNSGSRNTSVLHHPELPTLVFSADCHGEIFQWDLGIGRCVKRQKINGILGVESLSACSNKRLVLGASSGHVVICDLGQSDPMVKEFKNLEGHSISILASHPTRPECQLACASDHPDITRMFNVDAPPFAYTEWPPRNSFIGHISAASISPRNMAAFGTMHGTVKLFHLHELP